MSAAANGGAVLGLPGVDDPIVIDQAPRAAHVATLLRRRNRSIDTRRRQRASTQQATAASRQAQLLPRDDRVGTDLRCKPDDQRAGITRRVDPLGDRPQRVARAHDVGHRAGAAGRRRRDSARDRRPADGSKREREEHQRRTRHAHQQPTAADGDRCPPPAVGTHPAPRRRHDGGRPRLLSVGRYPGRHHRARRTSIDQL